MAIKKLKNSKGDEFVTDYALADGNGNNFSETYGKKIYDHVFKFTDGYGYENYNIHIYTAQSTPISQSDVPNGKPFHDLVKGCLYINIESDSPMDGGYSSMTGGKYVTGNEQFASYDTYIFYMRYDGSMRQFDFGSQTIWDYEVKEV